MGATFGYKYYDQALEEDTDVAITSKEQQKIDNKNSEHLQPYEENDDSLPQAWHSNDHAIISVLDVEIRFQDHYGNDCMFMGKPALDYDGKKIPPQLFFYFRNNEYIANCKLLIHHEMQPIRIEVIGDPILPKIELPENQYAKMEVYLDAEVYHEYEDAFFWINKNQRNFSNQKNDFFYFFHLQTWDGHDHEMIWDLHFCKRAGSENKWDLYSHGAIYLKDVKIISANPISLKLEVIGHNQLVKSPVEDKVPGSFSSFIREKGSSRKKIEYILKRLARIPINPKIQDSGMKVIDWRGLVGSRRSSSSFSSPPPRIFANKLSYPNSSLPFPDTDV